MELYVDGNVATSASPGDDLSIDTGSYEPGAHTLRVRAYDSTGQYDSSAVSVTFI